METHLIEDVEKFVKCSESEFNDIKCGFFCLDTSLISMILNHLANWPNGRELQHMYFILRLSPKISKISTFNFRYDFNEYLSNKFA
jgi:hypothetical protein